MHTLRWPSFTLSASLDTLLTKLLTSAGWWHVQIRFLNVKNGLPRIKALVDECAEILGQAQLGKHPFKCWTHTAGLGDLPAYMEFLCVCGSSWDPTLIADCRGRRKVAAVVEPIDTISIIGWVTSSLAVVVLKRGVRSQSGVCGCHVARVVEVGTSKRRLRQQAMATEAKRRYDDGFAEDRCEGSG